jgi:hypothetical protein
MFRIFRPVFEVVKEGRILKKIKQLKTQIGGVFCLVPVWIQVLDGNGMLLTEKSREKSSPNEINIR